LSSNVHGLAGWESRNFFGGLRTFAVTWRPGAALYPLRTNNIVVPTQICDVATALDFGRALEEPGRTSASHRHDLRRHDDVVRAQRVERRAGTPRDRERAEASEEVAALPTGETVHVAAQRRGFDAGPEAHGVETRDFDPHANRHFVLRLAPELRAISTAEKTPRSSAACCASSSAFCE